MIAAPAPETTALLIYAFAIFVLYCVGQWSVARRAVSRPTGAEGPRQATTDGPVRALLVIVNAAANFAALRMLGLPAVVVALPAVVVLGAAFPFFAENRRYAGLLAWSGPLLPMTWPATAVGVAALALNSLLAAARQGSADARVRIGFDASVCTLIVYGGPLYFFRCGYNLGNIVFIHSHFVGEDGLCSPGLLAHETGHTLNVAAFGFVFHYLGAIHENWGPPVGGARHAAYAELWAESRRRAPHLPWVRGWAEASLRKL